MKRTCVYIALMDGEDESLSGQRLFKDHRWRIAEISWVMGSEKLKTKLSDKLHPHMLFGRVSRKNPPRSSKNKLQHIQWSDTTDLQKGLDPMVRWDEKRAFRQQSKPTDVCGANRDVSTPCPRFNTLLDLMCCGRSWTSCSDACYYGF